jgi:hypothetical protein
MKEAILREVKTVPMLMWSLIVSYLLWRYFPPIMFEFAPGGLFSFEFFFAEWVEVGLQFTVCILECIVVTVPLYYAARLVKGDIGRIAWRAPSSAPSLTHSRPIS